VEDDVVLLGALRKALEKEQPGWTCEFLAHPSAAFDLLRRSRWDVLVTDIDLPVLDGVELCRRARIACPRLQCIALTGTPQEELSSAGQREFAIYLRKPCTMKKLIDAVMVVVDRNRPEEPPPRD
jgi:two-component system response regulator YesN